jgi:hypothetical protein
VQAMVIDKSSTEIVLKIKFSKKSNQTGFFDFGLLYYEWHKSWLKAKLCQRKTKKRTDP